MSNSTKIDSPDSSNLNEMPTVDDCADLKQADLLGSEEDEEWDEDEDEDEEDEEPKLKYQRLGADVSDILQKDRAKCLVAHEKFLLLGTQKGSVHVLDLNGNEIMKLAVHKAAINAMSLDDAGDFVASGSDDGTVIITNLYTREQTKHSYDQQIKAVALPSNYEGNPMFATGGMNQKLIINTKGWFSRTSNNVIHAGEGAIYAISWRGDLIAWANELGFKLYDCYSSKPITFISRTSRTDPDCFNACICWADDKTILMGWGDSVKIGVIKEKKAATGENQKYVHIVALFETEFYICGIAPFKEFVVLLAYATQADSDDEDRDLQIVDSVTDEKKNGKKKGVRRKKKYINPYPIIRGLRPELRVMRWNGDDVSSDALPLHGFERCVPINYQLDYLLIDGDEDCVLYVVSPQDIVVARPRDADDHITWLLERARYQEALEAAQTNEPLLRAHTVNAVGEQLLQYLMSTSQFSKAASYCAQLLGNNAELWETWILVFAKNRQLRTISDYIPTSNPVLSDTIYEMVLNHFLSEDHSGFLRTIREWPSDVYSAVNVIAAAEARVAQGDLEYEEERKQGIRKQNTTQDGQDIEGVRYPILLEALADMYLRTQQYAKALHAYLRLGRDDVFRLIKELNLVDSIRDKVLPLILFDATKAIELCIEHVDVVPVADVVQQLQGYPQHLHQYLHQVFKNPTCADQGEPYNQLQVGLYAEYDPSNLLDFLRNSNSYNLEDALQICEDRHLYHEQVFILRRMGNTERALRIIIEDLHNVQSAIDFVEEHKEDQMLWEELITHSLERPNFLSELLDHVGSHYVDLVKLVGRIPDDLPIPNLKSKLIKIMSDCVLQKSVMNGCNNILKNDCVALQARYVRRSKAAIQVEGKMACALCGGELLHGKFQSIVVFFCNHKYHASCIESQQRRSRSAEKCVKCSRFQGGFASGFQMSRMSRLDRPKL